MSEESFKETLRYWVSEKPGKERISPEEISDVRFNYNEGWEGTDVTPGDPPSISVSYRVSYEMTAVIPMTDLGNFINEMAKVQSRGPFRA